MRILAIIQKEVIHIKRDFRMLYFSIIWPVLLLLLFGYTVKMDIENVDVIFVDFDGTNISRELFNMFKSINSINVCYQQSIVWNDIEKGLREYKYRAAIIIPENFSKKFLRGEKSFIQIFIDGTDNNTARILMGYLHDAFWSYKLKFNPDSDDGRNLPQIHFRFLYNPDLRSQNFIIPGLIAIIIMIICTLMSSSTIAGEWERGTMEQLLYTPVKSYELLLGKLLPYMLIGFIQVSLVFLTGIIIFKVPFRGNILLFYIASTVYIFSALGLGLFISLQTKSQQVSAMAAFLVSILPSFLLSGFVFPINSMPLVLQLISNIIPAKYFLNIIRNIFLKGAGFSPFLLDYLALFIFCLFFSGLGMIRFKKRLL